MIQPYAIPGLRGRCNLPRVNKIETIESIVCDYFKVTIEQVRKKDRHEPIITARHFLHYFLRSRTKLTLDEIGARTGGRDHTTVINSWNKINDWMKTSDNIKRDYQELDALL